VCVHTFQENQPTNGLLLVTWVCTLNWDKHLTGGKNNVIECSVCGAILSPKIDITSLISLLVNSSGNPGSSSPV